MRLHIQALQRINGDTKLGSGILQASHYTASASYLLGESQFCQK